MIDVRLPRRRPDEEIRTARPGGEGPQEKE